MPPGRDDGTCPKPEARGEAEAKPASPPPGLESYSQTPR